LKGALRVPDEKLLFFIAKNARLHGTLSSSTATIARHLGISQQSVSRKLRVLRDNNFVTLDSSPKGINVTLTQTGISVLKSKYFEMKKLFSSKATERIVGEVKTGLGEGAYYVSRPGYSKQFKELLGFKPFPGTLNLIIDQAVLQSFLTGLEEVWLKGFKTKERSFGSITAFRVGVGKCKAAIIFPERSSHAKNEIEVIAPVSLRAKMKLKEGSKVKVARA
jgi:riboflavin kinase